MAQITYNKLLKVFSDIATSHYQIKRFGSGSIDNVNAFTPESGEFPILWVIPQGVKLGDNSLVYTMRVLSFDIDSTSDSYVDEIYSDTLLILNDVLKLLKEESEDYTIINEPEAVPFNQRFIDYCVGWYCDFEIETATFNGNPECFVPKQ